MEFFRFTRDIPFMRHALKFNIISLITFLLAVFFLAHKGLNFGVDFRGGTVMEIGYDKAADL
ncbi:MAG: protein translocase subunit SecF, partial [Burkholderiales bacterium]|nr:protein translocase subunit SecF [Burkholderiales bacterium]